MSIPNSLTILPPYSPSLVTISSFSMSRVCFCFVNKFILSFILDSISDIIQCLSFSV